MTTVSQAEAEARLIRRGDLAACKVAFALTLNAPDEAAEVRLAAWDTFSVPADAWRSIRNTSDREAELVVITAGDGRKTPEWAPEVVEAVLSQGHAVDKSGFVAAAHPLPGYAFGQRD